MTHRWHEDKARCGLVCNVRAVLGEGPLWIAHEDAVYWVDIKGKALHRLTLGDESHTTWPMPEMIGWIVERRGRPGFIAGFKSGFARLYLDPLRIEPIWAPEPHLPDNRMNDAAVDRAGRIWAGTMDDRAQEPTGCLYRLDGFGPLQQARHGLRREQWACVQSEPRRALSHGHDAARDLPVRARRGWHARQA